MSTEQKRQARVHTAPMSMMVAVPAFQHSPMFGHFASSHTVASRCSLARCLDGLEARAGGRLGPQPRRLAGACRGRRAAAPAAAP